MSGDGRPFAAAPFSAPCQDSPGVPSLEPVLPWKGSTMVICDARVEKRWVGSLRAPHLGVCPLLGRSLQPPGGDAHLRDWGLVFQAEARDSGAP